VAVRQLFHRYVPAQFHDPFGLALRLVRSRDPAALFAMATAAGGVAAAPLDVVLQPIEASILAKPSVAQRPLIFVCGAPRSGTTVVYQTLVSHLPVAYFSNLTALFPRSPLTAHRLFSRFTEKPAAAYENFYGRTHGLSGTNDALFLWDRWLGSDRAVAPQAIEADRGRAMQSFFTACDREFARPLVNKNNSLNLSAHLVAELLPGATFLCVTRDKRRLARSLYRARCDIHGRPEAAYGVNAPLSSDTSDAVESVCSQAEFYESVNRQQRERLGAERFWLVSYEDFCRDPGALLQRVAGTLLGNEQLVEGQPPASFAASTGARVPAEIAARIDACLDAA
jgi:hypothetical protein